LNDVVSVAATGAVQKNVMILAGEASGDLHGARLVAEMRKRHPGLSFCGIGGAALKEAGVRILVDASQIAVVGVTEVFAKLGRLLAAMALAKGLLRQIRPDLLICIDFPDFNLRVSKAAKKIGIPILYYISPQVWAWRPGRVKKIRQRVDHMAVILPFEADFYRSHQVPVTFVGHPLLDQDADAAPTDGGTVPGPKPGNLVGLVPGSRDREVARHLPVMVRAASLVKERFPDTRFAVPLAPSLDQGWAKELLRREAERVGLAPHVEVRTGGVKAVLAESRMAITASGTVTLEAALMQTPMVIIYKVSRLTYWIGRFLVDVDHVGLANLIAGERIVPELLQGEATPEALARETMRLLADDAALSLMKRRLFEVRERLGGAGASVRTAAIAIEMLGCRDGDSQQGVP